MAMFDPSEQLQSMQSIQRMAMENCSRVYNHLNNNQYAFSYQSYDAKTMDPEIDMVIYDVNTRTYRTYQQDRKIRELEKELEDKKRQKESEKKEEEESLKKLIAYYFNR